MDGSTTSADVEGDFQKACRKSEAKGRLTAATRQSAAVVGRRSAAASVMANRSATLDSFSKTSRHSDDGVEIPDPKSIPISRCKGVQPKTLVGKIVFTSQFDSFAGFIVLFNYIIMTVEAQAETQDDDGVIEIVVHINRIFLCFYIFECGARLYELGWRYFLGGWNNLDIFIVLCGIFSEVFDTVNDGGGVEGISLLKSLRMVRLLRLMRLLLAFRELYTLLAGLGRCMKTLIWSAGLIFLALNVWAILSVEFLHPLVVDLTARGEYTKCIWCQSAFSNVWLANLTWFQFVAGENWNDLMRPLIEHYQWPFLFIAASVFIVVWGFLNLIVAAIVDSAAQAREDDLHALALMAEQEQEDTFKLFQDLCIDIDKDESGEISLQEFKEVWTYSKDLQAMCRVMGVEAREIVGLFSLLDKDGGGTLSTDEFIDGFYQMRTHNLKTTMFLVLKHAESQWKREEEQTQLLREILKALPGVKFDGFDSKLKSVIATDVSTSNPPSIFETDQTAYANYRDLLKTAKHTNHHHHHHDHKHKAGEAHDGSHSASPKASPRQDPVDGVLDRMDTKQSRIDAGSEPLNGKFSAADASLDRMDRKQTNNAKLPRISADLCNGDRFGGGGISLPEGWYYYGLSQPSDMSSNDRFPKANGVRVESAHPISHASSVSKPLAGLLPAKNLASQDNPDVGIFAMRTPCCAGSGMTKPEEREVCEK